MVRRETPLRDGEQGRNSKEEKGDLEGLCTEVLCSSCRGSAQLRNCRDRARTTFSSERHLGRMFVYGRGNGNFGQAMAKARSATPSEVRVPSGGTGPSNVNGVERGT